MRRVTLAFLIAVFGALGFGIAAEAHALLRSSVPADGATLERPPAQVTITFTERPDPRLSNIRVYNAGGQEVERGGTQTVSGDAYTLTVALPPLPNGVYTVAWRTVSAVDGHNAAGSFSFGVGISPAGATSSSHVQTPSTPPPPPAAVAGRWIYYVGLGLLVGGTWISLFALTAPSRRLMAMAVGGVIASGIGLAVEAQVERETASLTWGDFFSTSLGGNLTMQLVPLLLAGIAVAIALRLRALVQWWVLAGGGAFAIISLLMHVLTTHANASQIAWLALPAQLVHLAAFTVWIGGLGALLFRIRGLSPQLAARAVRRFSFVAGIALGAIGATGLLRAIDEVGSIPHLVSTLFGGLVLVKVALFVVLAALGALNRYRNVPRAEWSLSGLRRVGRVEIGVAALVIAVAAVLTQLPPPSYSPAAAAPAPQQLVVNGQDLGTTVKLRLVIAPGYPGGNRFDATVRDYDTGQLVDASRIALRFDFPGRPAIGESTLELKQSGRGHFATTGTNLSLAGRWTVTAVVEHGVESAEVPMTVTTAVPPERITVQRQPGLPDIYTVELPKGRSAQLYVDSSQTGFYQIHATFFDGTRELAMADGPVISATPQTGPTVDLPVSRFDPIGHFIGQGPLSPGNWRFDVTASATDGALYQISFEQALK